MLSSEPHSMSAAANGFSDLIVIKLSPEIEGIGTHSVNEGGREVCKHSPCVSLNVFAMFRMIPPDLRQSEPAN